MQNDYKERRSDFNQKEFLYYFAFCDINLQGSNL